MTSETMLAMSARALVAQEVADEGVDAEEDDRDGQQHARLLAVDPEDLADDPAWLDAPGAGSSRSVSHLR